MPQPDIRQDPLIRLADELHDLSSRLAGVAEALLARSVPPPTTGPVVTGSALTAVAPPASTPMPRESVPPVEPIPVRSIPVAPVLVAAAPSDPPGWASRVDLQSTPEPWSWPELPPDQPASATWDRVGSRSLAWVGAAVTLLGVVLLLVLAIQRGWLGPLPRLLCGLGFSAGLLAVGWRVRRKPSGLIGGLALTATGIAALYLDVVAATSLYAYLPVAVGLVIGLGVAVAGLLLAGRWKSPTLAIFVVLAAAACAPIITHGVTPLLVAFLLVLAWAAIPVHLRHRWRWLVVAADLPPLAASLVLDRLGADATASTVTATAVVALVTVLAYLGLAAVTALRGDDEPMALGLLIAAPTPIMAAAPLLTRPSAAACLVVVSALLFALWAMKRRLPARFAAVAGAAGTVTLFQATMMTTVGNTSMLTITLLGQALLLAATAYRVQGWGPLVAAAAYATVGLVAALAGPVPLALLVHTPQGQLATATLRSVVAVAALLTLTVLVIAGAVVRLGVGVPGIWWSLGFVGLYGFSGTVLGATMLAAPDQQGFLIGQVLVTIGWTVCALLLLVRGIEAVPARMAGLALVAGALTKLIAFDLSTLDGVARVAAFLGSGLVLLAAGVRYARAITARRTTD